MSSGKILDKGEHIYQLLLLSLPLLLLLLLLLLWLLLLLLFPSLNLLNISLF